MMQIKTQELEKTTTQLNEDELDTLAKKLVNMAKTYLTEEIGTYKGKTSTLDIKDALEMSLTDKNIHSIIERASKLPDVRICDWHKDYSYGSIIALAKINFYYAAN